LKESRSKFTGGMLLSNPVFSTALAPMQDVTGLPFMKIISGYGDPDLYFTEYFRVYEGSRLNPEILSSITCNPSSRPIFAQILGESVAEIIRVCKLLQVHSIEGVDLNMGCPAPRVFKKNVGGGLLKDPAKIKQILLAMKSVIQGRLTVKMRVGFEDDSNFFEILEILKEVEVDLLSLHTRTVLGGYRSIPDHSYVTQAVNFLSCPVLLNGNVTSAQVALKLQKETGAAGIMIGRSAIRNPWIFRQIRDLQEGQDIFRPRMIDLYEYVSLLLEALKKPDMNDVRLVARIKKFLNFVGLSVSSDGEFLHFMRRAQTSKDLFAVCKRFMLDDGLSETFVSLEPFDHLVARPSQETCSS
jgi:tRNA-dihydrouridine synthase B